MNYRRCGLCAFRRDFFGFIHSVMPAGGVYVPWSIGSALPYQWAAAYLLLAITILALSKTRAFRESSAH